MPIDHSPFDVVYRSGAGARPKDSAITVAVSLFDYQRFIEACLGSVLRQTHAPIELIVVDDDSHSDTSLDTALRWMRAHAARFDRTVLLKHRANSGLAAARNTAFAEARTKYVFVMDADNEIHPRALERLNQAMEQGEGAFDAAYSQLQFFGTRTGLAQADVWSKRRFKRGNYVDAMALISKRSLLQVGGYSHIEGGWEDFDLWCKFIEADMTGLFVPEILCRYRVHASSMLATSTASSMDRLKVELTIRHPWLDMG